MTQTAADRHTSFSHKSRDRYSTLQYDKWSSHLSNEYARLQRRPTLDEFMGYLGRQKENIPRATAKELMERRWLTGSCRPRNHKNSMGVSPQNFAKGTADKIRFEREMKEARAKMKKKKD